MSSRSRRRSNSSSRSSSQDQATTPEQRRLQTSAKFGDEVSIGGSLVDASTSDSHLLGAGIKIADVGADAGISNKGVYGDAHASVGEVTARIGRDDDVAQLTGKAEGPNAHAGGHFGLNGIGFDAGASVGDLSADGHIGRRGTDRDAALTGGVEGGGGARLKAGLNFGRDTDGDGVPNYGFNLGAKLGVGFNVGVDVERPMEHLKNAGSAVAGWFGF